MIPHFNIFVQNTWLMTNTERTERQKAIGKTSFRKETVENADSHKPVLNRIMATQE